MSEAGRHGSCLAGIDVAILAGGLGTRIRGVLGDTPKVLAPIAGRPFLDHLLDRLAGFGARRAVLCLGHLAARIEAHLARSTPPLPVETATEPEALGTAGALALARPMLRSDPVLVMNGDTWADADLCAFLAAHRTAGTAATLLCVEVEERGRYGSIDCDAEGRVVRFREKDAGLRGPGLVSAGTYLLSAALLDRLAAGTPSSLEHDVLTPLAPDIHAHRSRAAFIDIGTPESLEAAPRVMLSEVRP